MKIPAVLRVPYRAWMAFSHVLGLVMSSIMLTILWIVAFGFYGIVLKISHILRPRKDARTEWKPLPAQDAASLHTQF